MAKSTNSKHAVPKQLLDWGELAPLKLRARQLTEGLYTGAHRSRRRGSGIEFGGHRDYTPGDDLRHLDHRALLRHGRLLIREFETETERCVCLIMDATASMGYLSQGARCAKQAYASLLAAALGRIAVSAADRLSLDWIGGASTLALPSMGGREAFERLVGTLESARPGGDEQLDAEALVRRLVPVHRRAGRGSAIILFSDLVDLPKEAPEIFSSLSGQHHTAVAVQVLDPVEDSFPFTGALKLKPSFGSGIVETDARDARTGYLKAMAELRNDWGEHLLRRGGQLVTCTTSEEPIAVLRRVLRAVEGAAPLEDARPPERKRTRSLRK